MIALNNFLFYLSANNSFLKDFINTSNIKYFYRVKLKKCFYLNLLLNMLVVHLTTNSLENEFTLYFLIFTYDEQFLR